VAELRASAPTGDSSLDLLLDMAAATGARVTWGRTILTRRHWVALGHFDGRTRVRRARTRAEAARRLLVAVYGDKLGFKPRA
jgi:hypothetical protein